MRGDRCLHDEQTHDCILPGPPGGGPVGAGGPTSVLAVGEQPRVGGHPGLRLDDEQAGIPSLDLEEGCRLELRGPRQKPNQLEKPLHPVSALFESPTSHMAVSKTNFLDRLRPMRVEPLSTGDENVPLVRSLRGGRA